MPGPGLWADMMSAMTAGVGTAQFVRRPCIACTLVAVTVLGALLTGAVATVGGQKAQAAPVPVVHALAGWSEFQVQCTEGPAPGQGSSPQACRCWETRLEAVDIVPGYAVLALDAAQVGEGDASTVGANLAGGPVGWAMQGCGLYTD